MRTILLTALLRSSTRSAVLAVLLCAAVIPLQAAPLSGTKSVGPTGNYTSLTAAIADIQTQTLGGALVLELQATYLSTVETFPLTIPALNGASAVNTLTIRPATGATARVISSADTTAATVDLNGAQFVTIDGRPGGVGSHAGSGGGAASQLTIQNTTAFGQALRFINEASGNTLRYTTLRGMNVSTTSGTVLFSTTTGADGNDNNTVDHCDLRDGVGGTSANGIYALGTTATTAQNNSGNTVSNCNLFNFHIPSAVDAAGVRLDNGNTDWTLTGNSFYQTASRSAVAANVRAIYVNSTSGNNFIVTSNYIGGSAPNAGGTAWTTGGTSAAYRFVGIYLNVGTTTPSSVQGNTIANMVWTSNSNATTLPGVWSGVYVQAGSVDIGTVVCNTIGSGTGTGFISVTTSGNGGTSFGIGAVGSGTRIIANNTIGSITVNGSTTVSASLTGIQVTNGSNTISNNTVGSTTTANSLNAATSSISSTGQQVTGILSSSSSSAGITSNTVANLNNNYAGTGTAGQIRGIVTSAGVNTITGNTIRNLSTTSQNTGLAFNSSVLGISQSSTMTGGQTVSQNTVHSLASTAASANVSVTGIYFAGPTSGTNVIARNLVHSLAVSSIGTSAAVNGMYFVAGAFTAQNNMVRVGLKADGTSTAGEGLLRGIYDNGTDAGRNFYHNSVYLGGTLTSSANSTYAFQSLGSTNARTFQNNIFVNTRSNSGGTGKHYAVLYLGTTGLTAGGNLFLASGIGGVLGLYNSADRTTLAAWQTATGQDTTSAVADPFFVNPTGTAAVVDLHLQASNPAEGSGIPLTGAPATVTDDFDGQTRSTLTPADIGADAGNFTSTGDIFAPAISYPLLTSGSTANRVLTGWATITDNSGSVSGGASAPRLYYKKSTDADVFGVANDSSGNGWKYVTATGSGPYSFTIDYSLINGGSVSIGDTIQYFVVAQDAANNLGSNPVGTATASANPPVNNLNGHGAVNSFIISPSSGIVTVGVGGNFSSLSGVGGLFAAINNGAVLAGNVVVNITSDLTETGSATLNQWLEEGVGGYTLTLQPDSATMRIISGSMDGGLITLNGADFVTIDGSFGGSGRYLTFSNTNTGTSASTIRFINDASNNAVRNCVVEGAGTFYQTSGVILFSTGTVTGNDNNLITGCQVRDLGAAAGVPIIAIGSKGNSAAVANSGNTVSNNELFNFNNIGIYITSTGNDSWTLSGNDIYEVNTAANVVHGIYMEGGGTNVISGNSIHDLRTSSIYSYGISIYGSGTTTISHNRITALNVSVNMTTVGGIYASSGVGSTLNLVNNQITLGPSTSGSTTLYGIFDLSSGGVVNAVHNSVVIGGNETGTLSSWASLRGAASTHTARNNLFLNLRTGGSGSHFAAGSEATGGSYTASHNVYAGSGAVAANFMDFNTTFGSAPVSFATWQSSTGDTASQAGIAGSGNFTSAMFVNAATGDLHLVPGGNVLVNALGTPIAGVTDDYDGDLRNVTTPTIGSDEFVPIPDIAVTQATAVADGGSIDFGTIVLGSSSAPKTFTITNPGTADLTTLVVTGGTSEFVVSALSGTSVAHGGPGVTFTVTFTPSTSGPRGTTLQITSNIIGTKNPFDIPLTGIGITPTQAFDAAMLDAGLTGPDAAMTATPKNDGVANLLKYAFNMTLTAPDVRVLTPGSGTAGLPSITRPSGSVFRVEFLRRIGSGLYYTPQKSAELHPLSWSALTDAPTVTAINATWERVLYEEPLLPSESRIFGKVRVDFEPWDGFEWVAVGDPGNIADPATSYGAVADGFRISAYEVTIRQYVEFLNAVAVLDNAKLLFHPWMATDTNVAGIARSGSPGSYSHSALGASSRPVAYLSWMDAARFVNWLHNGKGAGSTENGVYELSLPVGSITRAPGATYFLPSEHEWYKAAYHLPGGGTYHLYPTNSSTLPSNDLTSASNAANFRHLDYTLTPGDNDYSAATLYLASVGAFTGSASPWGTYDQGGSVWEWTETASGTNRITRGGSWGNGEIHLRSTDRTPRDTADENSTTGFRIAKP